MRLHELRRCNLDCRSYCYQDVSRGVFSRVEKVNFRNDWSEKDFARFGTLHFTCMRKGDHDARLKLCYAMGIGHLALHGMEDRSIPISFNPHISSVNVPPVANPFMCRCFKCIRAQNQLHGPRKSANSLNHAHLGQFDVIPMSQVWRNLVSVGSTRRSELGIGSNISALQL